jgi:hypothetical protein
MADIRGIPGKFLGKCPLVNVLAWSRRRLDAYCSGSKVIRKFLSNSAGLSGSGNGDAL